MDRNTEKKRIDKIIGNNIQMMRMDRNISTGELADVIGLTRGHVTLIERGKRGANSVTMVLLSKLFNVPVDRFFSECDEDEHTLLEEGELESVGLPSIESIAV